MSDMTAQDPVTQDPQAVPTPVQAQPDTANQLQSVDPSQATPQPSVPLDDSGVQEPVSPVSPRARETVLSGQDMTAGFDALVQEIPGAASVEQERTPEINPELQSWVEEVQQHDLQAPQQVVVADQTATAPTGNYVAEPVVVLPLSEEKTKQGLHHKVTDSVKWLATWCVKMAKKFHGMVVYRPAPKEGNT